MGNAFSRFPLEIGRLHTATRLNGAIACRIEETSELNVFHSLSSRPEKKCKKTESRTAVLVLSALDIALLGYSSE